mmetsp:Transcript_25965/g.57335  ORF Transcript_25965/g.57335 Transcript_25965/m.57335 type:complete len:329 (-) Transcript_25965:1096-2082(-)
MARHLHGHERIATSCLLLEDLKGVFETLNLSLTAGHPFLIRLGLRNTLLLDVTLVVQGSIDALLLGRLVILQLRKGFFGLRLLLLSILQCCLLLSLGNLAFLHHLLVLLLGRLLISLHFGEKLAEIRLGYFEQADDSVSGATVIRALCLSLQEVRVLAVVLLQHLDGQLDAPDPILIVLLGHQVLLMLLLADGGCFSLHALHLRQLTLQSGLLFAQLDNGSLSLIDLGDGLVQFALAVGHLGLCLLHSLGAVLVLLGILLGLRAELLEHLTNKPLDLSERIVTSGAGRSTGNLRSQQRQAHVTLLLTQRVQHPHDTRHAGALCGLLLR